MTENEITEYKEIKPYRKKYDDIEPVLTKKAFINMTSYFPI